MKTFYTWLHNMLRPSRAQHVPAGQEAEDEPIEQFALPDDDAGDLREERLELGASGLH